MRYEFSKIFADVFTMTLLTRWLIFGTPESHPTAWWLNFGLSIWKKYFKIIKILKFEIQILNPFLEKMTKRACTATADKISSGLSTCSLIVIFLFFYEISKKYLLCFRCGKILNFYKFLLTIWQSALIRSSPPTQFYPTPDPFKLFSKILISSK